MKNLVGGYWVLVTLPIWATAFLLYVVTLGAIFFLRDHFEGLFYNTSYSAMLGDGALLVVVLMGAEIIKRAESISNVYGGWFHLGALLIAIGFGFSWWVMDRPQQWGDVYHHLVIAPIFAYFAVILLPLILGRGTKLEVGGTFCLVLLWAVLVVYDAKTKRLAQRQYMTERGIYLTKAIDILKPKK